MEKEQRITLLFLFNKVSAVKRVLDYKEAVCIECNTVRKLNNPHERKITEKNDALL